MSPEILDGLPYSFKTDIWSMGCVLYLLCTLRPPFEAQGKFKLFNKVMNEPHEPISGDYSDNLRLMVDVLLSKSQDDRPTID